MQLDETTDVAGSAILLVFVRYVHCVKVHEELLLCKPLPANTTGEAIYNLIERYFELHGLTWTNCVDICTDGAKAMIGAQKGFVSRVKEIAPDTTSSHCILHREALAVKRISDRLKAVLDDAIKVVNHIETRPLQCILLKILCDEMGANHSAALMQTDVRWLSRGRVLTRLFELCYEIIVFTATNRSATFLNFRDPEWLLQLAYLADIFQKLNELNLGLQGKQVNVFSAAHKIDLMRKKLELWADLISQDRFDTFTNVQDFLREKNMEMNACIKREIVDYLIMLRGNLEVYFPATALQNQTAFEWVENPFSKGLAMQSSLTGLQNEQLLEVRNSSLLKNYFKGKLLAEFWARSATVCPDLSTLALKVLIPFVSTYLCEAGFSAYSSTKNKYRNRLDAENDMRVQLCERVPDFEKLAKNIQYQPSH